LDDAKDHIRKIGEGIKNEGLPSEISPFVVGFAGYGNVSRGAQEILELLPVKEILPEDLVQLQDDFDQNMVYKVVFKEQDLVRPCVSTDVFQLQEYYTHPEKYVSKFEHYLPYVTILMNCIYWDERYPRLVTKEFVSSHFPDKMKLSVIGDISVDINGSIEFTEKVTQSDMPSYVYNPRTDTITDGVEGDGIVVMAVDNLPCELPLESSKEFSTSLLPFVPAIAKADYSASFDDLNLPTEIKKAVILHHGKLTKDYEYIDNYL
jgi:alpha-aminoadipic semialdehyde synthase